MGIIKLYNIDLSPSTLTESKTVIVSHRLTSSDDIPSNYEIDTENLVVPVGGVLPEPYVIDGLDNDKEYTVKVTSDCGDYFFKAVFRTGYACPALVAGSMRTSSLQEVPSAQCEDCAPVLNGVPAGQISSMTAGLLTSAACALSDYVIDWYLDDEEVPQFTSGSDIALDDDISVVHPFAGEPVQGGVWHPRIRFVEIDGFRYAPTIMAGARWSPDLADCLPTITVQNYSCGNGAPINSPYLGGNAPYTHGVAYTNAVSPSSRAFRSFRFELDAAKRFFAWNFIGYAVYDTLKITYVSPLNNTSTVVEWWRIGNDSTTHNYTEAMKGSTNGVVAKIKSFVGITYAAGDYLLIEITPNPNTTNTNWNFYCKCLASIDCNIYDGTLRQINNGSVFMEWDAATCAYYVNYTRPTYANAGLMNAVGSLYNYHYKLTFQYNGGIMTPVYVMGYDTIRLQMRKSTTAFGGDTGYYWICRQLVGSSTIVRTGNVIVINHTHATDYNLYKTKFNEALANPNMSNYSADSTQLNHYKFFITYVRAANSCGDTQFVRMYYMHYSNPPVFDDANKRVTITLATKVNNYTPTGACDQTVAQIDSIVTQMNNVATSPEDYSYTSLISGDQPISGFYLYQVILNETDKQFQMAMVIPVLDTDVCDLATKQWTGRIRPTHQWAFHFVHDRVVITNQADPINNFQLWRLMNESGELVSQIKMYEISGGVVVP